MSAGESPTPVRMLLPVNPEMAGYARRGPQRDVQIAKEARSRRRDRRALTPYHHVSSLYGRQLNPRIVFGYFCDAVSDCRRAQRLNCVDDSRAGGLDLIVLVDTRLHTALEMTRLVNSIGVFAI